MLPLQNRYRWYFYHFDNQIVWWIYPYLLVLSLYWSMMSYLVLFLNLTNTYLLFVLNIALCNRSFTYKYRQNKKTYNRKPQKNSIFHLYIAHFNRIFVNIYHKIYIWFKWICKLRIIGIYRNRNPYHFINIYIYIY
mgnify:CR=1 FL=1